MKWKILSNLEEGELKVPTRLNVNGTCTTSPKSIAEAMNKFYLKKSEKSAKTLPIRKMLQSL